MTLMTSAKGIALNSYINTPDYTYNSDGYYKVTLVLPQNDETYEFIANLEAALAASVATAKAENKGKKINVGGLSIRVKPEEGQVHVDFKLMAKVTPKKGPSYTQKPMLFDAACKPTLHTVTDGSTVKVAFLPIPYFTQSIGAGITLRLQAVQVICLAGDPTDGRSFGFKREFGYEDDESV